MLNPFILLSPAFVSLAIRTTKTAAWPALLALLAVITTPAYADGVYKWVDKDGRAHYTDKPPEQGEHTQLHVKAAPEIPQGKSVDPAVQLNPNLSELQRGNEAENKRILDRQRADDLATQQRFKAEQQRYRDMAAEKDAAEKAKNDGLIADCKRNREVYCDKGLDRVKTEQLLREIEAENERKRHISHRD